MAPPPEVKAEPSTVKGLDSPEGVEVADVKTSGVVATERPTPEDDNVGVPVVTPETISAKAASKLSKEKDEEEAMVTK